MGEESNEGIGDETMKLSSFIMIVMIVLSGLVIPLNVDAKPTQNDGPETLTIQPSPDWAYMDTDIGAISEEQRIWMEANTLQKSLPIYSLATTGDPIGVMTLSFMPIQYNIDEINGDDQASITYVFGIHVLVDSGFEGSDSEEAIAAPYYPGTSYLMEIKDISISSNINDEYWGDELNNDEWKPNYIPDVRIHHEINSISEQAMTGFYWDDPIVSGTEYMFYPTNEYTEENMEDGWNEEMEEYANTIEEIKTYKKIVDGTSAALKYLPEDLSGISALKSGVKCVGYGLDVWKWFEQEGFTGYDFIANNYDLATGDPDNPILYADSETYITWEHDHNPKESYVTSFCSFVGNIEIDEWASTETDPITIEFDSKVTLMAANVGVYLLDLTGWDTRFQVSFSKTPWELDVPKTSLQWVSSITDNSFIMEWTSSPLSDSPGGYFNRYQIYVHEGNIPDISTFNPSELNNLRAIITDKTTHSININNLKENTNNYFTLLTITDDNTFSISPFLDSNGNYAPIITLKVTPTIIVNQATYGVYTCAPYQATDPPDSYPYERMHVNVDFSTGIHKALKTAKYTIHYEDGATSQPWTIFDTTDTNDPTYGGISYFQGDWPIAWNRLRQGENILDISVETISGAVTNLDGQVKIYIDDLAPDTDFNIQSSGTLYTISRDVTLNIDASDIVSPPEDLQMRFTNDVNYEYSWHNHYFYDDSADSEHFTTLGYEETIIISEPDATEMIVDFGYVSIGEGDFITLLDSNDNVIQSWLGPISTTVFPVPTVEGNEVKIYIKMVDELGVMGHTHYGFEICSYDYYSQVWSAWEGYQPTKNHWILSPGECEKIVHCQVKDVSGNIANEMDTIIYDISAPITTFIIHGDLRNENWYNTQTNPVIIELNTEHNNAPERTFYNWNPTSTPTNLYTGPIIQFQEGEYSIHYYSKDDAGNSELSKISYFRIDNTPPTFSSTPLINNGELYTINDIVTLSIPAIDARSGVYQMRFKNNDVAWGQWSSWEPFSPLKQWQMNPYSFSNVKRTISCQIRDYAFNTIQYDFSIILGTMNTDPTPNDSNWINSNSLKFSWDYGYVPLYSAVYHYIIDNNPNTIPDATDPYTNQPKVQFNDLNSGIWYIHLTKRYLDTNVEELLGHYQLKIDLSAPTIEAINPQGTLNDNIIWSGSSLTWRWDPPNDGYSGLKGYIITITRDTPGGTIVLENAWASTNEYTFQGTNDITYYANVKAVDYAGNEGGVSPWSLGIRVDNIGPINTEIVSKEVFTLIPYLELNSEDPQSGFGQMRLANTGDAWWPEDKVIETPHNNDAGTNLWYDIYKPGAYSMQIHFVQINTREFYGNPSTSGEITPLMVEPIETPLYNIISDSVTIYDDNYNLIQQWSGVNTYLADVWSLEIPGDTIHIQYTCADGIDDIGDSWGFLMDKYNWFEPMEWGEWMPYSPSHQWQLEAGPDGLYQVYFQTMDFIGNMGNPVSDYLNYMGQDNTPPIASVIINDGAKYIASYSPYPPVVTLDLFAMDNSPGSGVKDYRWSTNGVSWSEWMNWPTDPGTGPGQAPITTDVNPNDLSSNELAIWNYFHDGWYPLGAQIPQNSFEPSRSLIDAMILDGTMYFSGNSKKLCVVDQKGGIYEGETLDYQISVSSSSIPLTVSLIWQDDYTPILDDLDLSIRSPAGVTYLGNGINDDENRIEQIIINNPITGGMYNIRVYAEDLKWSSAEPFALVVSGGLVNGWSQILLDRTKYDECDVMNIRVEDTNNPAPWSTVNILTDDGDTETLTLPWTNMLSGVFLGSINLEYGTPIPNNNILEVLDDTIIQAYYEDGLPRLTHTTFASVDITLAAVTNIEIQNIYLGKYYGTKQVFVEVRDKAGNICQATDTIIFLNQNLPRPFTEVLVYQEINITLSVEGREWNNVDLIVLEDGLPVTGMTITRIAGDTSAQNKTITLKAFTSIITENGEVSTRMRSYEIRLQYNGRHYGKNPFQILFESNGHQETIYGEFAYTKNYVKYNIEYLSDDGDLILTNSVKNAQSIGTTFAINNIINNAVEENDAFNFITVPMSTCHWDFGDGTDAVIGEYVTHTYNVSGTYLVTLTFLNDNDEIIATVQFEITV